MSRLTKNGKLNYKNGTGLHLEYKDYASETVKEVVTNINKVFDKLSKFEDLEEDLGCPLNVRCKVVCDSYIYDENGIKYEVVYVYEDHFDCEDPFDNDMGYTKLCAFEWKDYKQDWFLKEDRSE